MKLNHMKRIYLLLSFLLTAGWCQAQNVYGTLDTWHNYSVGFPPQTLEAPTGWKGADSLVCTYGPFADPTGNYKKQLFKTTDVHGGAAAARLMTRDQDTLGIIPGLMTNADMDIDLGAFDPNDPLAALELSGGTPVTQRISTLSAWIKYEPRTSGGMQDRGQIGIQAIASVAGNDSIVGIGTHIINSPIGTYTKIDVPVTYIPGTPNPYRIVIGFFSSIISNASDPVDSSVLYVDDVSITNAQGVEEVLFGVPVNCSVNAAAHTISLSTEYARPLRFQAFSSNGQLVQEKTFTRQTSISYDWASGIYAFRVLDEQGRIVKKDKLLVP